jgi:hypothetical protein
VSSKIKAAPFFSVEVNGKALDRYASDLKVIQETDRHTLALLDVQYQGRGASNGNTKGTNRWTYLQENTPVRITYGMYPAYTEDFLGYVASYKILRTTNDNVFAGIITTRVQYTIVGTSMPMQSTHNFAWKHVSPSAIASRIAVKNGLRAIVHPYNAVYDYRLQNASDFQFLCELADEIGYRFYVDNTDLYFVDPNVVLAQHTLRNIPQFWALNAPGIKDTLESFSPSVGTTTSETLVAKRSVTGINSLTGRVVDAHQQYALYEPFTSAPRAPVLSQYDNTYPVDSYAEAVQRLNASTLRNQFWTVADATVLGDYRVKPNKLVEFTGAGVPEDNEGLWLVKAATHTLYMPPRTGNVVGGKYSIDMKVLRNQSYTLNYSSPNALAPVLQTVGSKLINGVWRSVNVGAQRYAS